MQFGNAVKDSCNGLATLHPNKAYMLSVHDLFDQCCSLVGLTLDASTVLHNSIHRLRLFPPPAASVWTDVRGRVWTDVGPYKGVKRFFRGAPRVPPAGLVIISPGETPLSEKGASSVHDHLLDDGFEEDFSCERCLHSSTASMSYTS